MTLLIAGVEDHGTVVTLVLREQETERPRFVHWDRRPFAHMIHAEADGDVSRLIGREVEVEETEEGQRVTFVG